MFLIIFFAHEEMKKMASKVTFNRPIFLFSNDNQPKFSPNLNSCSIKNLPPQDFSIMNLSGQIVYPSVYSWVSDSQEIATHVYLFFPSVVFYIMFACLPAWDSKNIKSLLQIKMIVVHTWKYVFFSVYRLWKYVFSSLNLGIFLFYVFHTVRL